MVFGILEDHKLKNVPGTGLLSEKLGSNHPATNGARGLKRATGRSSHIVLIPQPSDDPCDPLNWPRWKKEACFWTLVFVSSVGDALWAPAGSAFELLAKQFRVSVDEVASAFSANFLGLAAFALIQNTFAFKFGHRIVYLFSTLVMFISCVWNALSPNLASIRASRIFQGFGEAAPKILVPVTIEHLFFVHERGSRTSIWALFQILSAIVGGLVNSYVTQDLSWQFGFWFFSIVCGVSFIGVLFFVPETTYPRNHDFTSDTLAEDNTPRTSAIISDTHKLDGHLGDGGTSPSSPPSYLSQLKIYNGTFSDHSLWEIFLQPFPFVFSPVAWFMFICYSTPMVLLSIVPLCSSTIFTIEYGFDTAQTGLTNLGSLVGIILALLIAGPLNDWGIVSMSRRNAGIYEPEFRLVFMLGMLIGVFGYVGWAIGNDHGMPWIGAVACIAMLYFSLVISNGTSIAYLIDTHGERAAHIIALIDCTKGVISYAATLFANGVVLARGVKISLLILGACQAACWLAAIPMYVYGKRVRSLVARHPRLFLRDLPVSDSPQSAT